MKHTIQYVQKRQHLLISIQAKKDFTQEILAHLYKSIAPTHKEEGCLEYKLFHEEDQIIIKGTWKSKIALDMHLLLQYHLVLFEQTLPYLCESIHIQRLQEIEPPITSLSLSTEIETF